MGYTKPVMERFYEKVRGTDDPNGCWVWVGAHNNSNVGIFCLTSTKIVQAHRFLLEQTIGHSIPRSVFVHHLCGNERCVNPAHLQIQDEETRFWSFVDKESNPNGCWEWTGHTRRGYGALSIQGQGEAAHRLSYRYLVGDIPDGMDLLHSCDNRLCVNPAHLRPGTHEENMADMRNRKRSARGSHQHLSKLKEEDVIQIKQLLQDRYPASDLAAEYGVSECCILDIRAGRTWSWLEIS